MPLVLFQLSLERQQRVDAFELIHDYKYCAGVVRYRTLHEAGLTYSRQATVPALHETRRIHTKRLALIDLVSNCRLFPTEQRRQNDAIVIKIAKKLC